MGQEDPAYGGQFLDLQGRGLGLMVWVEYQLRSQLQIFTVTGLAFLETGIGQLELEQLHNR